MRSAIDYLNKIKPSDETVKKKLDSVKKALTKVEKSREEKVKDSLL